MIPRIANLLLLFLSSIILGDLAAPVAANSGVIKAPPPPTDASKASKNGKAGPSSLFNIQPFTCPRKCVDAIGVNDATKLLEDAIVDCDEEKEGQEWIEHKEGNVVQWESVVYPGMCLAVEHDHDFVNTDTGATETWTFVQTGFPKSGGQAPIDWRYVGPNYNTTTTVDACTDGVVGLIGCGCPSTKWYNTGSQLLSLSCWEAGFSTSLSVDYDGESGECLSQLKSVQDDSGDVTWASTFMFVEAGSSSGGGLGYP